MEQRHTPMGNLRATHGRSMGDQLSSTTNMWVNYGRPISDASATNG